MSLREIPPKSVTETQAIAFSFRHQPLQWLVWRIGQLRHPYRLVALFIGILAPLGVSASLAEDILDREELRLDAPILLWLHAHSSPMRDRVFLFITEMGGFLGTSVASIAVAIWLWKHKRGRALLFWALSTLGAGAANVVIKLFFRRERPTLWTSISPESDSSFPSGHAMLSTSFALALLLLLWPTKWRRAGLIFVCVWPVLVGVSRLYLGVHFPSDVLVGWCAGVAWTSGVYTILRGERNGNFEMEMQKTDVAITRTS